MKAPHDINEGRDGGRAPGWASLVQTCVGAALIVLLLRIVPVHEVAAQLRTAVLWPIGLAILVALAGMLVSTLKLWLLVRAAGEQPSFRGLLGAYYVGAFFNSFLPTSVGGDVFRVNEMQRQGMALDRAAAATVVERGTGLATVLLLSGILALAWPGLLDRFGAGAARLPLAVGLLASLAAAAAAYGLWIAHGKPFLKARRERPFWRSVYRVIESFYAFRNRPSAVAAAFGLSVVFYALIALNLFVVVRAVRAALPFMLAAGITPLARLPEIVPVSAGGLGVRESALAYCLAHAGLPAAQAASVALLLRLVVFVHAAAGGCVFALTRRRRKTGGASDVPAPDATVPEMDGSIRDADRESSRRVAAGRRALVFAMAVWVLLASMTHARMLGQNDLSRFAAVEALVRHHTMHLNEASCALDVKERDGHPTYRLIDIARFEGRFYSSKPPVLSLLLAGTAAALEAAGIAFSLQAGPQVFLLTWLLIGGASACGLYAFRRKAGRMLASPREADVVTALALGGTLFLTYSTTMNHHTFAAAAILIAFFLLGMDGDEATAGKWRTAAAGFLMALATVVDCGPGFTFSIAFAVFIVLHRRCLRTLVVYALGGLLPLALHCVVQYRTFHTILPVQFIGGTKDFPLSYWRHRVGMDALSIPRTYYWLLTLFSMRGLFVLSPVLLIGAAGLAAELRSPREDDRGGRCAAWCVLGGVLFLVLYYGFVAGTNFGGVSYGMRWFIGFTPLLAFYAARGYARWRGSARFRRIFFILGILSLLYALIGTVNPWMRMERSVQPLIRILRPLRGF